MARKNRIFVCGDIHGLPEDTKKLNGRNFREQKELTKEDVLIQLGDFGWVWYEIGTNKEQEYWLDWLAEKNYTLAVVLGNHENYDIIEALPLVEKWGNEVHVLKRNNGEIYFFKRGGVYTINNRKILTIGGAESTDKEARIAHISWWEQEVLSHEETEYCLNEIASHNNQFDYVLSHTCPAKYVGNFTKKHIKLNCYVARFLDHIDDIVSCKKWHFGHFHQDKSIQRGKYTCHYTQVPFELK
jgi:Calcineurin-like phosphoesterase